MSGNSVLLLALVALIYGVTLAKAVIKATVLLLKVTYLNMSLLCIESLVDCLSCSCKDWYALKVKRAVII